MSLGDEIRRQNPWWRGKRVALETTERELEPQIWSELNESIVSAVTGMRRVGKTTLLQRIINRLLEKTKPLNILYYSFDIERVPVKELLQTYFEEIRNIDVESVDKTYVLLDEVQKIGNWSGHVKAYADSYNNLKFVVTGSSSANIRRGGGESLVGRMSLHHLNPFSFREFLKFKGIKVPRKEFGNFSLPVNGNEIRARFGEYMETGGFPGLLNFEESKRRERLRDIIDLALFRDVIEIFDLNRPELLNGIFRIISSNSGQTVNYNKISRQLDAQYRTVKKYIECLESSFLIGLSRRFEKNVFKEYRKRPKIYVSDHAFCGLESAKQGLKAETVAFNHLAGRGKIGYWRNNNGEVDLVVQRNGEVMGLEIKYKKTIKAKELNNLKAFGKKYPESKTFLITKETLKRKKEIKKVPLWLFSLHL